MSQGPLAGALFTDRALLDAKGKSLTAGTKATARALSPLDSRVSTLFAPVIVSAATADSRVSAIVAAGTADNTIKEDAIFTPNGAMNSRWPIMSPSTTAKKLATLRWPNSSRAGLVRIDTDNTVYYRYFNGSSWESWQSLGGSAYDIAAAVYANGQADIFRVDSDRCHIYNKHSLDGKSWSSSWVLWESCGDQLDVAIMPDGTGWAALRATGAGNLAVMRYFNGSSWDSSPNPWTYPPGTLLVVHDIDLLAYLPPVCCAKRPYGP